MPGLVSDLSQAIEHGLGLRDIGIAWAKAAPVIAIVPAFGLKSTPAPMRATMALLLAICVAPALATEATGGNYAVQLLVSAAHGIPIAIAAAIPMWTATMTGGVVDSLRGASDTVTISSIEGQPSGSGAILSLITSTIFLGTGGPSRVAMAIAKTSAGTELGFARAALDLTGGIEIAIATAGPVIAASIVLEIGAALIARSSSPTQIHVLLAPLRSLGILAIFALSFDRIARLLALFSQSHPAQ